MFSKNAESKTPAGAPENTVRVGSITRRLTLLYAASTAALLLLACGYLYWSLNHSLDISRRGLVGNKIAVLRLLLREQPAKADVLASEVEHEATASNALKYYIRVLDGGGRVLIETPGMEDLLPVSKFPPPAGSDAEALNAIRRELRDRRTFMMLSVGALRGNPGDNCTLQIAMDISTRVALMVDYRHTLLAILCLGLVFAAAAGAWVARMGMRPLTRITALIQHITASQIHERISGSRWPSELDQLAVAFDAMLDRLEDSFTRLSQFSADLAHELRTPINNLRGEAEVALTRSRTPEEYQQILASSLEEHDRLSRMIDGLLFLARADDPKTGVERVHLDARKEIETVRDFYGALAGEKEVELKCEGEGWITADPMLLRRAMANLVANALQHTPAHGIIRIAVRQLDDQATELSVHDTGDGIAEEHLPRIFDRFHRIAHSHSETTSGTGLGLAIVQSIMRLHAGAIGVQSVLGEGTTITLMFPAGVAASPPSWSI